MKVAFVAVFLLVVLPAAWAQRAGSVPSMWPQTSGAVPLACGPKGVSFKVTRDKKALHAVMAPEAGKARIYFIQETWQINGTDQSLVGVDGAWVGGNRGSSYFSVSVDPGERHICAAAPFYYRQPQLAVLELAHLEAEAGKTYFYRVRESETGDSLELLDSDQGKYLVTSYPLSVFRPK